MVQFTQIELNGLKEQVMAESLATKKCQDYAAMASDVEIKQMCQSLAAMHQNHCGSLARLLGQGTQSYM